MEITRNHMIYLWEIPDQKLSNWMEYWTLTYDRAVNELNHHIELNNEFWVEYYTAFITFFVNKKLNRFEEYHEFDNNELNTTVQYTTYKELEKLEAILNNIYCKHVIGIFNDTIDMEIDDEVPNWCIMPTKRFN